MSESAGKAPGLIIVEGSEKGRQFSLALASEYTIGKSADCGICLNDVTVSRLHAKLLVSADGAVYVEDCGSLNGTYIDGMKISADHNAVAVPVGSVIRVGNTSFHVAVSQRETSTRMVQVKKNSIRIGRDPDNDIVLDHPLISRRHAVFEVEGVQAYITDLASTNGTYVDGVRVTAKTAVSEQARIMIGGYRFRFDIGKQVLEQEDQTAGQIKIEVRGVSQTVREQSGKNRGKTKTILNDINLVVKPREFVAILGVSGAGKSTLMDALCGMRPANGGEILVNGVNLYQEYAAFQQLIGYVPQADIVHQELTVAEVVTFAARLRLPDETTEAEIAAAVDGAINDLELTAQRDVLVRDLSGGQKKRVSIAVEMLTKPTIFFLDEPTSGLDPGLEKVMMELLRKLANQGRTVILVTHATFNIKLCDKVCFLARNGHLSFFGSPAEALAYFQADDFADIYKKIETEKGPAEWGAIFRGSSFYQNHIQNQLSRDFVGGGKSKGGFIGRTNRASGLRQWKILTERYITILGRDRKNLLILLLQAVIIPLIIVMIFHHASPLFDESKYKPGELKITQQVIASGQLDATISSHAKERNRFMNMVLCIAVAVFSAILLGASNSVREIVKELPVFRRERLVSLKITPYLMSKVVVLTAICLIQSLLLVGIVTVGLGLPKMAMNFVAFSLVYVASMLMGLVVSAVVTNADKAGSSVILLLIPQILLSGAIVPISAVKPEALQHIFDFAISRWAFGLIGKGICQIPDKISPDIVKDRLMQDLAAVDVTMCWWALALFVVLQYAIADLALRRKYKLHNPMAGRS